MKKTYLQTNQQYTDLDEIRICNWREFQLQTLFSDDFIVKTLTMKRYCQKWLGLQFFRAEIFIYLISETNSHCQRNLLPESGTVVLIASYIFESVDNDEEEVIN